MPQAETYLMRAVTPTSGVMVGDFSYVMDGQLRPVILKTGDTVDIEHVEVARYVASATSGMLASMAEGGSIVKVLVEVSEKTFDALRDEFAKNPKPRKDGPYAHATQTVMLEAGIQVAVSGLPTPQKRQAPVAEEPVSVPVVNAAEFAASPIEAVQAGAQEEVVAEEEIEADWKDGRTLTEQEKFLKESVDKEFLTKVSQDPKESKKIRRLAKARLDELA